MPHPGASGTKVWPSGTTSVQFPHRKGSDDPGPGLHLTSPTRRGHRQRIRAMQAARQRDLMLRSRRAVRWLQPGLVVKRWLLTSGIGLVLALLGAAVWADLQPIYWTLWAIQESLSWITRVLPRGITGPLVLLVGVGLLLLERIDLRLRLLGEAARVLTLALGARRGGDRVEALWDLEKEAQAVAFDAAQIGRPCGDVDAAARAVLEKHGLGPEYQLPGLPHRTGHGIGLEIHEGPYLVRGDDTPLATGMCFSNEPMIVVPGQYGIRLEDHFYMTDTGARWFTEPQNSLYQPL